jgi:hypothetical protein
MAKKSKPPVVKSDDHARQADAEKTMHLRALRDAVAAKVWKRRPPPRRGFEAIPSMG